ncbi:hypothetical protein DY000_02057455 [Brassica cretica]|uniref:Uncharacterized protein n=1 Tax=Brassica cretica TaxID=69181 RepID=A0ABQ7ADG7_BRACR|nr:hypothetical protein DY000_02057455 [Brassica cretica]
MFTSNLHIEKKYVISMEVPAFFLDVRRLPQTEEASNNELRSPGKSEPQRLSGGWLEQQKQQRKGSLYDELYIGENFETQPILIG